MNVCFSVDGAEYKYVPTIINSIVTNSANSAGIRFHSLVDSRSTKTKLEELVKKSNGLSITCCTLTPEDTKFILKNMRVETTGGGMYIKNIMNFARFFIPEYFPFDTCLYLDVDMIVQTDLFKLLEECDLSKYPLWATPVSREFYTPENLITVGCSYLFFIAGLYYFDCKYWKETNITQTCKDLMVSHKVGPKPLFKLGTQPILNTVFYQRYGMLDPRWNVVGLGGNPKIPAETLKNGYVLHWNGKLKPWDKGGLYRDLWRKYVR